MRYIGHYGRTDYDDTLALSAELVILPQEQAPIWQRILDFILGR